MSEETLKFNDVVVSKKEFHTSKQTIALNLVATDKIVVSDKFKYSDNGSKYCIGYLDGDDIIRPLCIMLLQMSEYIKYFDDGGKNMSFKIEDGSVFFEYNEIGNNIKKTLSIRYHSQLDSDNKYIKTKTKTFNGVINTLFADNKIPKEGVHYIFHEAICINSILKVDKKNYP